MAFTPAEAEDQLKVLDDAPMATRLRNHKKTGDVKISQPQSSRDKPNQSSSDPHVKSKPSIPKKILVHNASSPLRIGQPSIPALAKKSSDSTSRKSVFATSLSRTGQPLTVDRTKKNYESKSVHLSSTCTTKQASSDQSAKNSKDSALKKSETRIPTKQASSDQSAKNSKDYALKKGETHITSCKTSQLLKNQSAKNSKDSMVKNQGIHLTSSQTSEASKDQDAKNSKNSTMKGTGILIPSSSRKSQPSKDHQVTEKKIKDFTPAKRETRSKHLTNPHSLSKDFHPKRESSLYSIRRETRQSKISISKPSPSDVKQKKEKTIPSAKPATKSELRDPMHYIRWGGFDKPRTQLTGWNCDLCEKDLANSPMDEESDHSLPPEVELVYIDYSDDEYDDFLLPEVTVLPCNHVFHSMCLQLAASEDQLTDLYCPMCSSYS
ncbi:hypothetical protein L6164_011564 [Bauhinia variegata]|uniref:Uncharacterized protein n=1 Tax=Bauhinia variegata TaxID=167791 RepID=A0ACB9P6H8_BAUVA|nr:hypothetical protein L6164_011564 [Bauhinia variegata]